MFELVTRRFERFELVTCGFELVTREAELLIRKSELVTRISELATYFLLFFVVGELSQLT